jgi:bifunctional non-homologous end joining protein LigD
VPTDEYRRKRDFARTPEPKPADGPAEGNRFVVHRHEARNLHYDLRIEAAGVLACWAVPKGFSYLPEDKRLAVRTEDHPLEYHGFEGSIPKGQYGAGTMRIWDAGTYQVRKAAGILQALEKGELKLELRGRRLRGEWHLVRTKQEQGRNWLLFKARDRYAGSGSDLFAGADMSRALEKPLPKRLTRMEAEAGEKPFDDPDWLFEPSFPGRRVLVRVEETQVSLLDGAEELAEKLPAIAKALSAVRASRALLDGVVVAVDAQGRPSEEALARELEQGGAGAAGTDGAVAAGSAVLYLFDLLYAEDWDLRGLPLRERKAALRGLLPDSVRLQLIEPMAERGLALARAAGASGLPAIVAKRAASPYRAGISRDWLRIPVSADVDATPGGIARGAKAEPARASKTRAAPAVVITHPRKVYWPEQGYTKGDLAGYYDAVAGWLLPYLRDRPLHLYRWPDGVRGKSFYQKQLPEELLAQLETVDVARDGEPPVLYAMCNDRRALLTLINTGSIDLHPWFSHQGSLDSPDWAVLDLDPKEASFPSVIKIARAAGRLLRGLGLEPYLKTSGSTGLHVYLPLKPGYTFEQSRMFCEAVARLLVRDHPELATVERVVSRREGRVYIDFLQNRREQTVVPPYVVRPVEAASVSMPLEWDELEEEFRIEDFNLVSAPRRLERTGDLFRTALSRPQDLAPAIQALEKML